RMTRRLLPAGLPALRAVDLRTASRAVAPTTSRAAVSPTAFRAVTLLAASSTVAALLTISCAGSAPPEPRMVSGASRAPYDSPPVNPGPVTVTLDLRAAREILAVLGKAQFDANDSRALELLPAVQVAIRESGRGRDVFEKDLAAAFDPQARITVFDFRRIRDDRSKWEELLGQISMREGELTKRVSDRARALLPATPAVPVNLTVAMTF